MSTVKEVNTIIGRVFDEGRKAKKLTQKELAVQFGSDAKYISNVENGRKNLATPRIAEWMDALDVNAQDLFHPQILKKAKARDGQSDDDANG